MSDFLNDLSTVVSNDLLSDLNFTDNTIDEFNHRISGDNRINDLTVFHMNIRSLNKNRSKLYNLLHSLDLTFDVIVLSEIWNCNLDLCNNLFGGYTFFFDVPADTVVGGVGRYVRNCFSCNVLNAYKMESTVKNRVENIWVEILSAKHKYTLGAIYRHPNQNISDFSRLLDSNLCRLDNSRDPCIIVGDLNIDLCKYSTHGPTKDYINNLLSNNFLPHIIMPTHYVGNSATIIDHIYFREGSVHDTVVNSGNLWCDETDHFPNYIIFQTDKILKNEHARPLIRLQSPRNMQTFQTLVSNVDWSDIYYCQDANEAFDKFENHLTACYEESFPLIRLSRRRARDKKNGKPQVSKPMLERKVNYTKSG